MSKKDRDSSYLVTGWESQSRLESDGFSFPESVELSLEAERSKVRERNYGDPKDLRIGDVVTPIRGKYKNKHFFITGWDSSGELRYLISSESLGVSFWIPFYFLRYLGSNIDNLPVINYLDAKEYL